MLQHLINLTPHSIKCYLEEKEVVVPPSGQVARVSENRTTEESLFGIPVVSIKYSEVEGIDFTSFSSDCSFLVSMLVGPRLANIFPGRVYGPDTSPKGAVRDEAGKIVGCKGLVKY